MYTPDADYNGPDSFTYTITDNGTTNGQPDPKSAVATVNVIVAGHRTELIIARTAVDLRVANARGNDIVHDAADEHVVTAAADDTVRPRPAAQHVVARAANERRRLRH